MSSETASTLRVHELTKRYGQITAVQDLSFHVRPGVVTGFLGPNGAGKSTTLRMILGLDKPTNGTATIGGRKLTQFPQPMRVVGALLDARAVHPRRSAADHLTSIAQAGGIPVNRIAEILECVGLADDAHRPAGDFSLGMKQRLGIGTALIGEPGIVIFDEPLNGLDPDGIRWARSLMRGLAAEGRTVLFSSHLMGEMELTADHLIVINEGRLMAEQPLETFLAAHTTERVHARTPTPDALAAALTGMGLATTPAGDNELVIADTTTDRVGHIAAGAGLELSQLTATRDSLEDAFLAMTSTTEHHTERSAA